MSSLGCMLIKCPLQKTKRITPPTSVVLPSPRMGKRKKRVPIYCYSLLPAMTTRLPPKLSLASPMHPLLTITHHQIMIFPLPLSLFSVSTTHHPSARTAPVDVPELLIPPAPRPRATHFDYQGPTSIEHQPNCCQKANRLDDFSLWAWSFEQG